MVPENKDCQSEAEGKRQAANSVETWRPHLDYGGGHDMGVRCEGRRVQIWKILCKKKKWKSNSWHFNTGTKLEEFVGKRDDRIFEFRIKG